MKEAYAVRRTVPPSAEIQRKIDELLSSKLVEDPQKMLSELARLGAKLIIQRAVEEEFEGWLRAHVEVDRGQDLLRAARALRNVLSPRPLRGQAGRFVPRCHLPAGPA